MSSFLPTSPPQLMLAGVGVLQTVPLFCTLVVERGMAASLWEVFQIFVSGGPLYFIFHIRTRDYYYTQTVLAGGATYRATGATPGCCSCGCMCSLLTLQFFCPPPPQAAGS
jgi:hypothetical protein